MIRTRRNGDLVFTDPAVIEARARATKAGVSRRVVVEKAWAIRAWLGMEV